MKFCQKCGLELDPRNQLCPDCGRKNISSTMDPAPLIGYQQPVAHAYYPHFSGKVTRKQGVIKGLLIAFALLVFWVWLWDYSGFYIDP
ncbi:MAG: hypothetical protein ACXAB7_07900 [Candidatus Kariarchaeaceae archaeon]